MNRIEKVSLRVYSGEMPNKGNSRKNRIAPIMTINNPRTWIRIAGIPAEIINTTSLPGTDEPKRKYPAVERKAIGAVINKGTNLGARQRHRMTITTTPNRSSAAVPATVTNSMELSGIWERGLAIDTPNGFSDSWKSMEIEASAKP
ncbi:MAG: hypothetical protein ACFFAZ_13125 [Promethearchaeota archaeon]